MLQLFRELCYSFGYGSTPHPFKDPIYGFDVPARLPFLMRVSIFTSMIDIIARMDEMRLPGSGENRKFFVNACVKRLGMTPEESEILWRVRNDIVHQYKFTGEYMYSELGPVDKVVEKVSDTQIWIFIGPMLYLSHKLIEQLAKEWLSDSPNGKSERADFIRQHGFVYTSGLFHLNTKV